MGGVSYEASNGLGIAKVVFDRPESANALGAAMLDDLIAALDRVVEDKPLALLLDGRGRHFCAGADLKELAAKGSAEADHFFRRAQEVLIRASAMPCFTVATLHGASYGLGADLALSCHLRIGWGDVALRFPGLQFGVLLGSRRLIEVVGAPRALELLLSNRKLHGEEAVALGLLSVHVETELEAWAAVERWMGVLTAVSPSGRARLRELMAGHRHPHEKDDLEAALAGGLVARGIREYTKRVLT